MSNVNLDKQIVELFVATSNKRLAAIDKEIDDLEKEKADILKAVKQSKAQLALPKTKTEVSADIEDRNGYNSNWIAERKVDFVLKDSPTPLSTKEIVDVLMKHEPAADRYKMMRGISSLLSVKSAEGGKYERGKNDRNENTYELRDNRRASDNNSIAESNVVQSSYTPDDLPF